MKNKNKLKEDQKDSESTEIELQQEEPFDHLTTIQKASYGIAQLSNGMLSGIALGGAITFFYNYKIGLNSELTGLAWMIFAIWNALNDPLFGFLEDNTQTRWGRRVPYLRFGAPIYAILFILCWYPWGHTQTQLFWNFLINLMLFDTMYTIIGLVTYSLPAEMAISNKTRANLLVWGTYFGAIGMLISTVLPMFLLADKSKELHPLFRPIMVILGLTSMVLMIFSSYHIKENEYATIEKPLPVIEGLKQCLKNKPFLIFEGSNFSFTLAVTMLTTGIYYYTSLVLELEAGFMSALPIALVFGIAMLMTVFFSKKVEKYGVKKVYIFGLIWGGIGLIIFSLIGQSFINAVIMFILIGIGISSMFVTSQAIFADTVDFDELMTGKRRETTYAGVNALLSNKPAISIANALFLEIIKLFGYVEPQEGTEYIPTPEVKWGIMIGVALLPGIFMLLTGGIMKYFQLDGPKWTEFKNKLSDLHMEKEKRYLEYLKELEKGKKVEPPDLSEFDARTLNFSLDLLKKS